MPFVHSYRADSLGNLLSLARQASLLGSPDDTQAIAQCGTWGCCCWQKSYCQMAAPFALPQAALRCVAVPGLLCHPHNSERRWYVGMPEGLNTLCGLLLLGQQQMVGLFISRKSPPHPTIRPSCRNVARSPGACKSRAVQPAPHSKQGSRPTFLGPPFGRCFLPERLRQLFRSQVGGCE